MELRRTVRGARRPLVVDLLVAVALASLLMTGVRAALEENPGGLERLAVLGALFGIPTLASLYGAAAAIEMRRGWVGSSVVTGLLHALLILGSLAGIGVLAILNPAAAGSAIAAEGMLLLWSSSWL